MRFAKWAALAVTLALAGCATASVPRGTENVTPVVQGEFFVARDGMRLPLRHWDAEGLAPGKEPRAVIVALHGMNDYSNAFDQPGRLWAKQGFTTLAYDQRGFGAGPGAGLWPGSDTMREDLRDFVAAVQARHPGVPVFAVGESMGGAVMLTILAQPQPLGLKGVILVAPAVWSRSDMPVLYRVALFLTAHLTPGLILSGNGLKIMPSDNIPMLRAFSRDPLVIKETRADAVLGLVNLMDEARQAPDHLGPTPPILFLYGKNDQVIPRDPTEAVVAALGSRATVRSYDKGYHMLMRDLEGPMVQQDVADWMAQRLAD
jgi:alpha-beta hydrolase superfamily lysophospholipase